MTDVPPNNRAPTRWRITGLRLPGFQTVAQRREGVRALLAFSIFALLCFEIVFGLFVLLRVSKDPQQLTALKDVLGMVLSPTVALFGAATGFYYGTRQEETSDRQPNPPTNT
jgi:hypothetical protein